MSSILHLRAEDFRGITFCGREVSSLLVTRASNERAHSKKYKRCKTCLRVWKKKRGGR